MMVLVLGIGRPASTMATTSVRYCRQAAYAGNACVSGFSTTSFPGEQWRFVEPDLLFHTSPPFFGH
jgi:hypothetical protein